MKRSTSTFVIVLLVLVSLGLIFFSTLRFPYTLLIPAVVIFVFYSARHDIQTVLKGERKSKPLSREENFLRNFIFFVAFILIVTQYRFYPLFGLALLIFLWIYAKRQFFYQHPKGKKVVWAVSPIASPIYWPANYLGQFCVLYFQGNKPLQPVTLQVTLRSVIKDFKHKGLEKFFLTDSKAGIPATHASKLRLILGRLNASTSSQDTNLPGLYLHELKGDRQGTWSVRVSGNWRVTFRFDGPDATAVNYEDYH